MVGGGTPSQVWMGGTPASSGLGGEVPQPVLDGGYPILGLGCGGTPARSGWGVTQGTSSQVWMVGGTWGTPRPGLDGEGVPQVWMVGGVSPPPSRPGRGNPPPPGQVWMLRGTPPPLGTRRAVCLLRSRRRTFLYCIKQFTNVRKTGYQVAKEIQLNHMATSKHLNFINKVFIQHI